MRSGLNGESKRRTPYVAGEAPGSAKPQPSKVAGTCMEMKVDRLLHPGPDTLTAKALSTVAAEDARGFFEHAGHRPTAHLL
jgi:hypothetical protein